MTTRARLLGGTGELSGRSFDLGSEATVGRAADNQIVLADSRVSGHHGRVAFDEAKGCFVLEDLGSRNGTYLNGMRVREPEKLDRLEVINFAGAYDFIFQVPAGRAGAEAPPASAAPRTMLEEAEEVVPPPLLGEAAASGRTVIDQEAVVLPPDLGRAGAGAEAGATFLDDEAVVLPADLGALPNFAAPPAAADDDETETIDQAEPPPSGPAAGGPPLPAVPAATATPGPYALEVDRGGGEVDVYDLPPGEHLIGRGKSCTVAIDNPTLSRKHARLIVVKGRVRLVDLGSTNHSYLAESELPARTEVEIEAGAELRFGAVTARLLRKGE